LPTRDRDLLRRLFVEKRAGLYVGVDPTAPSLHVGHMLPFMVLAWAYVSGLPVTFLVGVLTSLRSLKSLLVNRELNLI
jgi:tyrosyl-tRNA synthetase